MTLEGWSEDIARPVMEIFPSAWIFFLIFIFIATFIVVNLFVAVIVDSINSAKDEAHHEKGMTTSHVIEKLNELRIELAELKEQLKK
jgi:voltage-gated sodium channel